MKQFNVEEYLKKHRRDLVTRDGRKARILCCDLKNDPYTVVAAVMQGKVEMSLTYTKQGKASLGCDSPVDLFFAPKKHEGWVNVWKLEDHQRCSSFIYSSEEEAKMHGKGSLATIKVEWEEE